MMVWRKVTTAHKDTEGWQRERNQSSQTADATWGQQPHKVNHKHRAYVPRKVCSYKSRQWWETPTLLTTGPAGTQSLQSFFNSLNIYHTPALPCPEHQSALWETIVRGQCTCTSFPGKWAKQKKTNVMMLVSVYQVTEHSLSGKAALRSCFLPRLSGSTYTKKQIDLF